MEDRQSNSGRRATRILIVDDDIRVVKATAKMLQAEGYDVLSTTRGSECLELCRRERPDLVLLDVIMPDADGYEVCRAIKNDPALSDVYVMLISGTKTSSDHKVEGLDAHADDYITRPIPAKELLTRVRTAARLQSIQKALRSSEERYRALFHSSRDALMVATMEDGFIDGNSSAVAMFGCKDLDEFTSLGPDRVSPRVQPDGSLSETKAAEMMAAALDKGSHSFEWQHMRIDGTEFLTSVLLSATEVDGIRVIYATVRDITESKQTETTLRESEERHRLLFEQANDAMFLLRGVQIVDCNPMALRMLEYDRDELLGKYPWDISPPQQADGRDSKDLADETAEALYRGEQRSFVWQFRRKDGALLEGEVSLNSMDIAGEPHILAIVRDVTERRRTENALSQQRQILENVLSTIPHFVFWKDHDSVYMGCNDNFARVAGLDDPKEIVGKTDHDLAWTDEEAAWYIQCDREVMTAGTPLIDIEESQLQADGRKAVLLTSKVPLRNDQGDVIGLLGLYADITERKQAEEDLRESEAFLGTLLDAIPIPVFYKDKEGRYQGFNQAFETFFGTSSEQLLGKTVFETNPRELAETYHAKDAELLAEGGLQQYESQVLNAYGDLRDVIFNKAAFRNSEGAIEGLIGVVTDITERKRAEEEIRSLAAFPAENPNPVLRIGTDDMVLYANEAARVLLACLDHEPDTPIPEEWRSAAQSTRRQGSPFMVESSGRFSRFALTFAPVQDAAYVNVYGMDITERKRSEEELKLFRSLIDQSSDILLVVDSESGRILDVNDAATTHLGYAREELCGMHTLDVRADLADPSWWRTYREDVKSRGYAIRTSEYRRKDDSVIPVETSMRHVTLGDREYLVSFVRDITERKRAEERLSHIQTALDCASDAVLIIREDGIPAYANMRFGDLFGHTLETVTEAGWSGIFVVEEDAHSTLRTALAGSTWTEELDMRSRDGKVFPASVRATPILDDTAVSTGMLLVISDISERRAAECELETMHKELLEASRRAGMSEVATSVLHNVGNVLNSVNVSATVVSDRVKSSKVSGIARAADLLTDHTDDLATFLARDDRGRQLPAYFASLAEHLSTEQEAIQDELALLVQNIDHIKSIVNVQQDYARTEGVVEPFAVEELVNDALRMHERPLARHRIEVARDYDGSHILHGDRQKVLQIVVNLIRNAKQALRDSDSPSKQLTVRTRTTAEDHVRIEVVDNGVGIAEEHVSQVFTYGFTTKKDGHGFGLHHSALLAKEIGSKLDFASDGHGRGATFWLELPVSPKGVSI